MTMKTSTLTDFLLARIAEDEELAREASIGSESWHLDDLSETVLWWKPSSPEQVAFIRERMGDEAADRDASWQGQTIEVVGDRIAPHIARHDPARVLAECEAKRRIVEQVNRNVRNVDSGWLDHLLAHLAAVYADHPDYSPDWRP